MSQVLSAIALFVLVLSLVARAEDARGRADALAKGDADLEKAVATLWGEASPQEKVELVLGMDTLGRGPRGLRGASILAAVLESGAADLDAEIPVPPESRTYPALRVASLKTIGEIGDGSLIDVLVPWLSDPRSEVRYAAVQALGFLGDPAAIPHLRARLQDDDRGVRDMAGIHLERLEKLQEARSDLGSSDPKRRAAACGALADARQTSAYGDLVALLDDEAAAVRAAAAQALGSLRLAVGTERLSGLLGDPAPEVRRSAATALGLLDARGSAPAIRKLLSDPDAGVRAAAAYAASLLMDREAIPSLAGLLEDPPVSANAAAAMGRILKTGWGQNPTGVESARAWWQEHREEWR